MARGLHRTSHRHHQRSDNVSGYPELFTEGSVISVAPVPEQGNRTGRVALRRASSPEVCCAAAKALDALHRGLCPTGWITGAHMCCRCRPVCPGGLKAQQCWMSPALRILRVHIPRRVTRPRARLRQTRYCYRLAERPSTTPTNAATATGATAAQTAVITSANTAALHNSHLENSPTTDPIPVSILQLTSANCPRSADPVFS